VPYFNIALSNDNNMYVKRKNKGRKKGGELGEKKEPAREESRAGLSSIVC